MEEEEEEEEEEEDDLIQPGEETNLVEEPIFDGKRITRGRETT